jgi:hypothetical protein
MRSSPLFTHKGGAFQLLIAGLQCISKKPAPFGGRVFCCHLLAKSHNNGSECAPIFEHHPPPGCLPNSFIFIKTNTKLKNGKSKNTTDCVSNQQAV